MDETRRRGFDVGHLRYHPCPCGAWLGINSRDPSGAAQLLRDHNITARHLAWQRLDSEAYGGR